MSVPGEERRPTDPADRWREVDRYLVDSLVVTDPGLTLALTDSAAAGLPAINVAPNQGKLLQLWARMIGARSILEVGTLGGYSTIWLARALPAGGRIVTLEAEPHHAEVAAANLDRAGVGDVVDIVVGRALDTLPVLAEEGRGPFDLTFIDADKQSNADYFRWAVQLSRPGAVIVVDNVVRGGAVADGDSDDPAVVGTRRLFDVVAAEPRVSATAVQTVGAKGHDGFLLAVLD
jgi:predicted O-methyltransferase YrrM